MVKNSYVFSALVTNVSVTLSQFYAHTYICTLSRLSFLKLLGNNFQCTI